MVPMPEPYLPRRRARPACGAQMSRPMLTLRFDGTEPGCANAGIGDQDRLHASGISACPCFAL
jgi:hypothetical protein